MGARPRLAAFSSFRSAPLSSGSGDSGVRFMSLAGIGEGEGSRLAGSRRCQLRAAFSPGAGRALPARLGFCTGWEATFRGEGGGEKAEERAELGRERLPSLGRPPFPQALAERPRWAPAREGRGEEDGPCREGSGRKLWGCVCEGVREGESRACLGRSCRRSRPSGGGAMTLERIFSIYFL